MTLALIEYGQRGYGGQISGKITVARKTLPYFVATLCGFGARDARLCSRHGSNAVRQEPHGSRPSVWDSERQACSRLRELAWQQNCALLLTTICH